MIIKSLLNDLLDNQQFIEIVLSQIIIQLCQGLIRVDVETDEIAAKENKKMANFNKP